MTNFIIFGLLLAVFSTHAAEPTIKSMAHATYLCGENGFVIKTAGLTMTRPFTKKPAMNCSANPQGNAGHSDKGHGSAFGGHSTGGGFHY